MQELSEQYHIKCRQGDIGRYCILAGAPERIPWIAAQMQNAEQIRFNREFNVWTGYLCGEKVTACSTGIGGPSTAIALWELHELGADTFIRCGTCGGIDTAVKADDLVIATSAIRYEHTSVEFAPIEFPAVADFEVTMALNEAAQTLGYRSHLGVVHCKDSFYGQHCPEKMPIASKLINLWDTWKKLGVKASEMESAAMFVIGSALGCRCGSCFHVVWNQEREKAGLDRDMEEDAASAILTSVAAMKILIRKDQNKNAEN